MASTYSPKLRFELIGAGEQAGLWGSTTNKNVGQLIEQAIAGVTTVELDGLSGNYTLTALDGAPDQSRSAVILCTYSAVPASGAINLIIPTQTKLYVVRNDCGQTITVKTSAQTGGVQLLNGEATLVFCDGTDAIVGLESAAAGTLTVSGGGTGATTFTAGFIKSPGGTGDLTSSATVNASSELSGTVPIARGGTGVSTVPSNGQLLIGNGTGYSVANITGGSGIAVANSAGGITISASGGSGITQITTSGAGISVSGGTGPTATISNTGVTAVSGGTGISVSASTGSVSISSTVNPSDYVTTSGSQSISGDKTFTSNILCSNGVYVDGGGTARVYYLASNIQSQISGSTYLNVGTANTSTYKHLPFFNNSVSLGDGSFRWTEVFAINGTINTSDIRLKTDVTPSDLGLGFIRRLNPVYYKWIVGHNDLERQPDGSFKPIPVPGTRHHYGLISQEVKAAYEAEGATDFAGWCLDDPKDPNSYQALRYTEFIGPMIKAIKDLADQVDTLKAEVAALKGA